MAPPPTPFMIITMFLLYSINSPTHSNGIKNTTRLIHRDSIHSPFYNTSQTTTDRAKRAVPSSRARHAYLTSKDTPSGIEAGFVLDTRYNLSHVNFSIGQPLVPQLAILDTASKLLWAKSKTYFPRPSTCGSCTSE
ncbi:Aspartic proteinase CDR1 [Linum perenne]